VSHRRERRAGTTELHYVDGRSIFHADDDLDVPDQTFVVRQRGLSGEEPVHPRPNKRPQLTWRRTHEVPKRESHAPRESIISVTVARGT
jgi:hypothetical protein